MGDVEEPPRKGCEGKPDQPQTGTSEVPAQIQCHAERLHRTTGRCSWRFQTGAPVEWLARVEESPPRKLRGLKDPVDALPRFIPKLSGIPGAPGESTGSSVLRWEHIPLLFNELP